MLRNILKNNKSLYVILGFILITSPVFAISEKPSDFTGDCFYTAPLMDTKENLIPHSEINNNEHEEKCDLTKTIPPVKLIRLKAKAFAYKHKKQDNNAQEEISTNSADNQIIEEEHPLDNDDNKNARNKRKKISEQSEQVQITIDCKHMDYATETGIMTANENVLVTFPQQGTTLKSKYLTFDKAANKMHAEGDVVIEHSGQKTYGDSIDVDLNEESIFIANPITESTNIKIRADEGYVQKNIITQINGQIDVEQSKPFIFRTSGGPDARIYMRQMQIPDEEKRYITDGKSKIFKIQANEINITSRENLDILQLKKAKITCGNKKVINIPRVKIYSNKGHDFIEGNYPEIGARRYLGMFVGPGFVVELPKGCLLKLMPAITYKNKIGVGGVARFWSATNMTQIAYGTSKEKVVIRGEQDLDDNLKLIYASHDYLNNWFLGRRMPKYGADLVYKKSYSTDSLFKNDLKTTYEHRINAGYFHDMYEDRYHSALSGSDMGTTRFRYMARLSQPFYKYENKDKQFYTRFDINFEGASSLYGTGDTQIIGRVGPNWHVQYRKWMQDIGYRLAGYDDHTPIPVFDAYRYGNSQVYLREYLRLCPYLTLAWQGSVTLAGETYNNKTFQECSFYASMGPQDLKVNLGFDFVRQNAFINLVLAADPKGTTVTYDKMVIKNPENFSKLKEKNEAIYKAAHIDTNKKNVHNNVLTKAIITDIKENIDDI